ncbi:MAG: lysophospholipid acyltransferase family protein [bacterium]
MRAKLSQTLAQSARAFRAAKRTVGVFGSSLAVTAAYAPVGLVTRFDARVQGRWTRRWAAALTRGFGLGVDVTGERPGSGALIIANHRSYVDIVAIGGLVEACFIGKADIQRWPVLSTTFRLSNTIFVERDNPASGRKVRRQVTDRLRQGLSIINFAEGTTHDATGLLPFKMGLFKAVFGMQLPIIPTTITYSGVERRVEWVGDDTFLDHFLLLAGHRAMRAHVHFGEPLLADTHDDLGELVAEVRRRMLRDLSAREGIDPDDYPELAGQDSAPRSPRGGGR